MQGLLVADLWFPGHLADHVRDMVQRVIVVLVEQRATRQEGQGRNTRCRRTVGGKGRLRAFDRQGQPELVIPVLDHADLRLAGPAEADGILRVDGGRRQFVARRDSLGVQRHQRPALAGQQFQPQ